MSTYDIGKDSFDGIETITVADKATPWSESIEYPSANQMIYLRRFFESFDWWNLVPVLSDSKEFEAASDVAYVCAKTPDTWVLYFYSKNSLATGEITGLQPDKSYLLTWYNPRTGEAMSPVKISPDQDGRLYLPEKPDPEDWVISVTNTEE